MKGALSLEDWLALLEARHPVAIDLGLERVGEVWRRMERPQPARQVFVVAGTNGKGSTVATLCGLLGALGKSHGSYTSPHVFRYNERVQVNGRPVSNDQLLAAFEHVERARGETSLSYFEFGTLAAFDILSRAGLDFAVMEVGLGGRLDAVNLLDADCAVITAIGIDHMEYLGPDRESIGREKAGVLRAGRPAVCGDPDPPGSVLDTARRLGARLLILGRDFRVTGVRDGLVFEMGEIRLGVPAPALQGPHQADNLATALAALFELLPEAAGAGGTVASGIRSVRLAGRLQKVSEQPPVWIDVGHNPLAAKAVAAALRHSMNRTGGRNCRCVLGMLADKDAPGVAAGLSGIVGTWYCAGLPGARGQGGDALANRIRSSLQASEVRVFETVGAALDAALEDCGPGEAVLVFGSFLTAAEAGKRWLADAKPGAESE